MTLPEGTAVAPFEWRSWGEEVVVYVESTAETHMLTADASRSLCALLEPTAAGGLPDMPVDLLTEFERIGLVSYRPS